MGDNEINDNKKYTSNAGNLDGRWDAAVGCGGASPNGAHSGLHSKPLDDAIGRVLASHCRGMSAMVNDRSKTQNTNKKLYLGS